MSENPVAESLDLADLLRDCCAALRNHPRTTRAALESDSLADVVSWEWSGLIEKNRATVVDEPSERFLAVSAMVLALYRVFEPYLEDSTERLTLITEQFVAFFGVRIRDYVKDRFDVDHHLPEEAFDKVNNNFISRGERYLGKAFIYGREANSASAQENVFTVSECFFLNFFKRNGAPEVTKVLCAVDVIWAWEFNEGNYNLTTDRPTLMSAGDDICRFRFRKT